MAPVFYGGLSLPPPFGPPQAALKIAPVFLRWAIPAHRPSGRRKRR
ncbi:hypothetical protein GMW71_12605 [Pectobacterium brasiliense]|nr:hypothetical protein GMW71_12605 [Pectobacterium brasiliense]